MRARLRLQSPLRAPDDIGGAAISWVDQGDVWGAVDVVSVGAAPSFDTSAERTQLRITINRRSDVRAGWRVLWGSRVFRLVGVSDGGGPRIILVCEEERL